MLACAIALGWYVHSRNRRTLVGTWTYPTPDQCVLGYVSTLEIRADGTFTKVQTYRYSSDTLEGTYTVGKDSRVVFHVTSKTTATDLGSMLHRKRDRLKMDVSYEFRCATDPAGYLVLADDTWAFPDNDNIGIRWETCVRRTAYGVKGP